MKIVVIGASTGPGRVLYEQLGQSEEAVIGVARHARGLPHEAGNARFVELDASDPEPLLELIDDETTLIHCSRPELLTVLLRQAPTIQRIIAIGSTRIYTRFPDDKCSRLSEMVHTLRMGNTPATLLHPTMIYGAPGLQNVERVAAFARRSPWIPLPEQGRALIQPVHVDDVVAAITACLNNPDTDGDTVILAGQAAVPYREFVELCIEKSGQRCRVVSMPYLLMSIAALLTPLLPGLPNVTQDEIRRLLEDKQFDT
ncbi:MAG: hypothetical protein VW840_09890, partial [Gammaproteobacteria bacterium]